MHGSYDAVELKVMEFAIYNEEVCTGMYKKAFVITNVCGDHNEHSHTLTYRIAGNFRGYKISRIVPNLVKTKFSRFLISRSITVMARAYAQL